MDCMTQHITHLIKRGRCRLPQYLSFERHAGGIDEDESGRVCEDELARGRHAHRILLAHQTRVHDALSALEECAEDVGYIVCAVV